VVRVSGKLVQTLDAVGGNADDGGPGPGERILVRGERMRLQVTSAGISRGVEIHHHRALGERIGQRKMEALTAPAGGGGKYRRLGARREGGQYGHGNESREGNGNKKQTFHDGTPSG